MNGYRVPETWVPLSGPGGARARRRAKLAREAEDSDGALVTTWAVLATALVLVAGLAGFTWWLV
jgi:hypothetical protein